MFVPGREEVAVGRPCLVRDNSRSDGRSGQRMNRYPAALADARKAEDHRRSAMSDEHFVFRRKFANHVQQRDIVRLGGMLREEGHGIAAREHQRVEIVAPSPKVPVSSARRRTPEFVRMSVVSETANTSYPTPFS